MMVYGQLVEILPVTGRSNGTGRNDGTGSRREQQRIKEEKEEKEHEINREEGREKVPHWSPENFITELI